MTEIGPLLGQIVPAAEAAAGAYGVGVPTRAENAQAAQATGARSVSLTDDAGIIATGDGATNIRYR
ncbi:hypothetical protein MOV08_37260 [Streptomyces yunnanensis]|uniref:Uncharacterized protein n=1 Tax=Streptomyces yunnanensis TaxID=156453 RepID=A0ABY8AHB2_9ACTN|nr:hypothetical protein [Streptomyces yunnanensis]WEB44393.1 hypothetical protein MOV08_37260 [Streptomyces yunnanensis]